MGLKSISFQSHRYAKYIGATDEHDIALLDLRLYDDAIGESEGDQGSSDFRKVGPFEFFRTYEDSDTPNHAREIEDLDAIERIVSPHGEALLKLYFQVVHPSFPIMHKKIVLEKYARGYRGFAPAFLASIFTLALNWWSLSPTLSQLPKPDSDQLEAIAYRSLREASTRAKLSVVQAGLLLLQRSTPASSWQLTAQIVAMGQDLGLHLDCTHWRIPEWERAIRKRLAWALYMQDIWSALVYGRPPHINKQNWAVQPIDESDFPVEPEYEAEADDGSEAEKGRLVFTSMITLTGMLSDVLDALYSQKSEMEIRHAFDSTKAVLERAKPIQLRLRAFFSEMPDNLRLDATRSGTISSVGFLHLAYFATEITLHRRVIRSLSAQTDPNIVSICRSAAKARLISAMDFFNRLKPEHLQSFWYFPSKFNFALIGTFAALCFVTSVNTDEAEFYQRRLQEYRWTLKVSNKSSEFLEIASGILESAVGILLRVADGIDSKKLEFPMLQYAVDDVENYAMQDDGPDQYPSGTGTDDGDYDDISMESNAA